MSPQAQENADMLRALLLCDLKLATRRSGGVIPMLTFFALIVSLFPLGAGTQYDLLVSAAPAVVWMAVLLASTLTFSRVFEEDAESGMLEQYVLFPLPLSIIVLEKILAHWLRCGLPLTLASPIAATALGVQGDSLIALMLALCIGTPSLSVLAVFGAALSVGAERSGLLSSLLLMPLYVPIIIFGTGASLSSAQCMQNLAGLAAVLCSVLPLCVWGAARALKSAVEEM